MKKCIEVKGAWRSRGEMVAFAIYCAWSHKGFAQIGLGEVKDMLTVDADEVLDGLTSLAKRQILCVGRDLQSSDTYYCRISDTELANLTLRPEDYYYAVTALAAVSLPGWEVI